MRKIWQGVAASPGVSVGKILWYREQELKYQHTFVENTALEIERYRQAQNQFCSYTEEQAQLAASDVGDAQAEIIRTHVALARDPYLVGQIEGRIAANQCAEAAIEAACGSFMALLSESQSELIRQRASDVWDVQSSMLRLLLHVPEKDLSSAEPGTVLVADEISPSVTVRIDPKRIIGIITRKGGPMSHSAILARALEIPAVLGVTELPKEVDTEGLPIIVDGYLGQAVVEPNSWELSVYIKKQAAGLRYRNELKKFATRETRTADGRRFHLAVNVGGPEEAMRMASYRPEGIGLLRSEFVYMSQLDFPGEKVQLEAYRRTIMAAEGAPTVIRTLDIGGDKVLPYQKLEEEENPFLGYRGIRISLGDLDVFRTQLRAILRSGIYGPVSVMLPFVTGIEEVRAAKEQLALAKKELSSAGVEFQEDIPLGIMVETASAVIMADRLAEEVDFFSIGTNDLTQYMLSVDRGNAQVAERYSFYAPALLRAMQWTVQKGKAAGISVGVCGEAASDPLLTPVFLALEVDCLSVSPGAVLPVRREISLWTMEEASKLTEKVFGLSTEKEVRALLEQERRG